MFVFVAAGLGAQVTDWSLWVSMGGCRSGGRRMTPVGQGVNQTFKPPNATRHRPIDTETDGDGEAIENGNDEA